MINTLTNKHFIIALIVAPILAIIAYYAVDYKVSEKPHEAIKGQSYPLVAKSNCRYESGKCTFENGDIEITLVIEKASVSELNLQLSSNHIIAGAKVAITNTESNPPPETMITTGNSQTQWHTILPDTLTNTSRLQLALSINGSLYFGETSTVFTTYKTGFSQKNIQ